MDLLLDSSGEEEVDDLIMYSSENTRNERPLSREDLASLESFCSHPQVQNYRRSARGRRNAIYIPANRLNQLDPGRVGIEQVARRSMRGGGGARGPVPRGRGARGPHAAAHHPALFRTLSEAEFRMDISSSALRAQGRGL